MRRIAVFIGTRPEAIKMAPVVAALTASDRFEPLVVNTGQHRELIDQVIQLFGIQVDHDLAVMAPNQSLTPLLARLLERIDAVLADARPDMVLAQGDTSTVLATALAAFYRRIPFGHVEAGLRTGNLQSPFPEEANRVLTTPLAALHFAPTRTSADNLRRERIPEPQIIVTGNTVIDALFMELRRQSDPAVQSALTNHLRDCDRPRLRLAAFRPRHRPSPRELRRRLRANLRRARHTCRPVHGHLLRLPGASQPERAVGRPPPLGELENVRLIPPQPYSEFVALPRRLPPRTHRLRRRAGRSP